jgi:hypothetical protein
MNNANARKLFLRGLLAPAMLASCLIATPAIGQVTDRPTPPGGVTDTVRTRDDRRVDSGWVGLLGLVGLAGLMRKPRTENNLGTARTAAAR